MVDIVGVETEILQADLTLPYHRWRKREGECRNDWHPTCFTFRGVDAMYLFEQAASELGR